MPFTTVKACMAKKALGRITVKRIVFTGSDLILNKICKRNLAECLDLCRLRQPPPPTGEIYDPTDNPFWKRCQCAEDMIITEKNHKKKTNMERNEGNVSRGPEPTRENRPQRIAARAKTRKETLIPSLPKRSGAPAVTTGGLDEVEPATVVFLSGIMGFEVRPDLLGSVDCQAVASNGASVGVACGCDGSCAGDRGSFPAPELLFPAWGSASAVDECVGSESALLPTPRALVTGTTVRIWAETPFMMVWMVVGTVTTVNVVEATSGFPRFPFETLVLTGIRVVMGRLLTGQLVAPGGHLVSVYVDVESVLN